MATNGASAATAGAGAGAGAGAKPTPAKPAASNGATHPPSKYVPHKWPSTYSEHDVHCLEFFRKYLCERTVSSIDNYAGAVAMLVERATAMGLTHEILDMHPNAPSLLMKWAGEDESLPSLLLNSHMDVVPVEESKWAVDPWAAVVKDGKIFGRGAQDMKSVGTQYLDAIERMQAAGFKPKRNVFVLFVPDEEMSGVKGMQKFVASPKLKEINAGLALDEGLANPGSQYTVFYGERKIWWIRVRTSGNVGHGSRFIKDTAVEKLMKVANHVLEYRREQEAKLATGHHKCGEPLALGDVCTMNLTVLKAGSELGGYNVIPSEAEAGFDCRIPVTQDLEEFKAKLDEWTSADGVEYELVAGTHVGCRTHAVTPLTEDFEWWNVFEGSCKKMGMELSREVFPAATDSRYLRIAGVPALGFSPMTHTEILLHDHNEHVPVDVYLKGINTYVTLLGDLINTIKPSEQARAEATATPSPPKKQRTAE